MKKKVIDSFKAAISWLESKVLYGTTVGYDLDNEPDTNEDRHTDLLEWDIEKATNATKAVTSWMEWDRRKNKINRAQMDEIADWYKRYECIRAENPKEFEGLIPVPLDDAMYYLSKQLRIYDKMKRKPDEQTRTRKQAPKPDYEALKRYFKEGLDEWFKNKLMPLLEDNRNKKPIKRNKKGTAAIAVVIYEGGFLKKKGTFKKWYVKFCDLAGYLPGKSYYKNNSKDSPVYKTAKEKLEKTT